jgi:hypothetical protein
VPLDFTPCNRGLAFAMNCEKCSPPTQAWPDGPWIAAVVLLGLGSVMVYPTLLAAIGAVAHPIWRGPTGATSSRLCRLPRGRPRGRPMNPSAVVTSHRLRKITSIENRWTSRTRLAPQSSNTSTRSRGRPPHGRSPPPRTGWPPR